MSLYDSEASMIVDAWAAIRPYINQKERDDAAHAFIRAFENYVDVESMSSDIAGNDGPLDRALSALYDGVTDEDNYNDPDGDEDVFSPSGYDDE